MAAAQPSALAVYLLIDTYSSAQAALGAAMGCPLLLCVVPGGEQGATAVPKGCT